MEILVQYPTGNQVKYEVEPHQTIWDLKLQIGSRASQNPAEINLVFGEQTLDNNPTLESYGITNGSVVFMIFTVLGGARFSPSDASPLPTLTVSILASMLSML